jgi:hypothetical protein
VQAILWAFEHLGLVASPAVDVAANLPRVRLAAGLFLYWSSNRDGLARLHRLSLQLQAITPLVLRVNSLSPEQLRELGFLYPDPELVKARALQLEAWRYGPFR